jgi:uncharacterized protein (TIGR02246 family)
VNDQNSDNDDRVLLRRLVDRDEIGRLKARYFRTIDTKDWEGLRQVFVDDVVMDTTAAGGKLLNSADACIAFLQQALTDDVVTVHHGHTPEIEVTSPWTATGIWAMEDLLRWPDGTEMRGYGHYQETYQKVDGAWRIKTLLLTRLHMAITQPAPD